MHEDACELEVRDGDGSFWAVAGAELVADGLWPLLKPHKWFDVGLATEPHTVYASFGCAG